MLWLLPAVSIFVFLHLWRSGKRTRDLTAFGAKSHRNSRYTYQLAALALAAVFIILSLSRPANNPHPKLLQREGRDLVFLLDVSRSMLAEDLAPNRLESAKLAIAECVQDLQDHRVGLVVFGGSSSILCPLTLDKEFFLESLDRAGPDSVFHGGTRIGDALLKTCDKIFSGEEQGYRDIILLTDGGDQSESLDKAITQINEKSVKLIVLGLGDEKSGSRIPSPNEKSDYLIYKDQEVYSKLETGQLATLVKAADQGAFLAVGTRRMKLGEIYGRISEQEQTQQLAEENIIDYDEIYQIPIAIALLLLVIKVLIPNSGKTPATPHRNGLHVAALALCFFSFTQSMRAQEPETPADFFEAGNKAYLESNFPAATDHYQQALALHPGTPLIRHLTYNLGNSLFQQSKRSETSYESLALVNQSLDQYRKVLQQDPEDSDAAINNEIARLERKRLREVIAEEELRREELRLALENIKKQIEELITAQSDNLSSTEQLLTEQDQTKTTPLVEAEQKIIEGTRAATGFVKATAKKFFDSDIPEGNPLEKTATNLTTAEASETSATETFPTSLEEAKGHETAALAALKAALEELPMDPETAEEEAAQGEEEGEEAEPSEDGEPSDGDSESSEDGEGEQSDENSEAEGKIDFEAMDIPPPNDSPEDIINKNQAMQQARQSDGGQKKGEPVEKDW